MTSTYFLFSPTIQHNEVSRRASGVWVLWRPGLASFLDVTKVYMLCCTVHHLPGMVPLMRLQRFRYTLPRNTVSGTLPMTGQARVFLFLSPTYRISIPLPSALSKQARHLPSFFLACLACQVGKQTDQIHTYMACIVHCSSPHRREGSSLLLFLFDPAGRPLTSPCQSSPAPPFSTTLPGGGQASPLPAQAVLQTYM